MYNNTQEPISDGRTHKRNSIPADINLVASPIHHCVIGSLHHLKKEAI